MRTIRLAWDGLIMQQRNPGSCWKRRIEPLAYGRLVTSVVTIYENSMPERIDCFAEARASYGPVFTPFLKVWITEDEDLEDH